jgi:hypothetical protein
MVYAAFREPLSAANKDVSICLCELAAGCGNIARSIDPARERGGIRLTSGTNRIHMPPSWFFGRCPAGAKREAGAPQGNAGAAPATVSGEPICHSNGHWRGFRREGQAERR